ncbi:peptidoglycan DD-metalloendopeptidase family protein [Streptomyces sp. NBC_00160]|uniref:M23 family metallopeptidase n=1 Tax=Streptomyces sp. NBC_00160 TaxID=2903628 RepID=UPI002251F619|nr:peptidoglycan DD-metalloendopeptidase family protein [Streptomyces sp. NBC_00160]MCX5302754.1 peptidoglycan DD-metalloendopeptidase family protein [Streptomyces sp. NBC_00160]
MNSNDRFSGHASYPTHLEYDQQGVDNGYVGYGSYATGTFDQLATPQSQDGHMGGGMPGTYGPGGYVGGTDEIAACDLGQYSTGAYDTTPVGYDAYAYDAHGVQSAHQASYGNGSYDTTWTWEATGFEAATGIPAQPGPAATELTDTGPQWGAAPWADSTDHWDGESYAATAFDGDAQAQAWDQNSYPDLSSSLNDLSAPPGSLGSPAEEWPGQESYDPAAEAEPERTSEWEPLTEDDEGNSEDAPAAPAVTLPTSRRAAGSRNRRAPARRSALLTVALPSVAVIGIAGIAAASVGDFGDITTQAAPAIPAADPSVANKELDTRLAALSAGADDFAGRASRTQERIDLKQSQLDDQARREAEAASRRAEAARREALRPKFALPVAQKGVGELFGAVGAMWSKRHTGLDFPVPMNTPVMAVTDGTVTAKWNQFYGNMVIVTAPDGTETWYCHLASAKIRSGSVKAGDVIAYAGSTGNSSGPHLHLEVHPGGGDAVDPLRWLRGHGLDPT